MLPFLESVHAAAGPMEECYRGAANQLEVRPCLQAQNSEADAQLVEAEQDHRRQLVELAHVTGRDSVLQAFEQATKDFRAFRQSACRLTRIEAEPGTGAGDCELDCLVRMTRSWMNELRSRSPHD